MSVVLLALVFVNHVVGGGAVFVIGLGAALLHVLHLLGAAAFDAVTHHSTAENAKRRSGRTATTAANRIAGQAADQRTQQGAAPRSGCFGDVLLVLQTCRGTATCCTTGVLEITRAMMSMADAGNAASRAAVATAEMTSVFFMIDPLSDYLELSRTISEFCA